MSSKLRLFAAFLLTLALCTVAMADNTAGQLAGSVKDPNGDALPGATVNVENAATGLVRSSVTNARGEYRFPQLPIGEYTVTASMPGFQTAKQTARVAVGATTVINVGLEAGAVTEVLEVTTGVKLVDVTSNTSELSIRTDELMERVPVARNTTAAALLAPGSTSGDTAFGNLASMSGSSVAENAYNVNGLNITNFRNGLGSNSVPFEFIEEIQVKTGGYEAQFGRSTGGVVNTVTKSGTNEFHGGINFFFEPESMRSESPDSPFSLNSVEDRESSDVNLFLGGPIIKDKLFFFALWNPSDTEFNTNALTANTDYTTKEDFWGAKIDFNITPNHRLEFTAFSDERRRENTVSDYSTAGGIGATIGDGFADRGGENLIAKYTGIFGSNLVISVQGGSNKFDRTTASSADALPAIYDSRQGGLTRLGSWVNFSTAAADDEREAIRADVDYYLGNHSFRFGIDREVNTANDSTTYSGDNYYRYYLAGDGQYELNGQPVPAGTEIVRHRIYRNGGSFEVVSSALYLQDAWQVTPNFMLNLGARFESFNNKNAQDESFIKIDNQFAPRLGFVWDYKGDGTSKIYANWGRYHLPVAANTNVRLAGGEFFTADWYILDGLNADDSPIFNTANQVAGVVYGDGSVPNADTVRDLGIDPMYQDEISIGYETRVGNNWSLGVRGTFRELGEVIEDITIDAAVNAFIPGAAETGIYTINHTYILVNPGTDITFLNDVNGDGTLDTVNLTADQLGYPKGERNYYGLEFTFQRRWVNNWMLQGSYTWSHSYGNYEGWVRSDNGQDDAGIVNLFDHVGLMEGAYGNLPNDRRHNLKIFGGYAWDNGFSTGANLNARSGRPINAFGLYPTDYTNQADWWNYAGAGAATYGASSFFNRGTLVPRGSLGETDTIFFLDLQGKYEMALGKTNLSFRVDAFNILDSDTATEVYEYADENGSDLNPEFLQETSFLRPRTVRLSIGVTF